jgi:hypothetical protein
MSKPTDQATLTTRALAVLAHGPLSLEDESDAAETADAIFHMTVDLVFGLHTWSWARKAVALTRVAEPRSVAIRKYAFALPGDRRSGPLSVYTSLDPLTRDYDFRLQDGYVFAHGETRWADFLFVPPMVDWPPQFQTAFVKAFAAELAVPINELFDYGEKLRNECFGADWQQYQGGLFGRLVALDKAAQPMAAPMHGHDFATARRS